MGLNKLQDKNLIERSLVTEEYNILIKLYLSVKDQKNKSSLMFITLIGAIIILMASFVAISNGGFSILAIIIGSILSIIWFIHNHFIKSSLLRKEFMILQLEENLQINIFSEEKNLINKSHRGFSRFLSANTDEIFPYSMIVLFIVTIFFSLTMVSIS